MLTVMVCAVLTVPVGVAGKLNDVALRLSDGGAVPVPLNGTVSGGTPDCVEVMSSCPVRAPCAVGEKTTERLQLIEGFRLVAQSVALKSPVAFIWIPLTVATPGLDIETRMGLLLNPCAVPGNVTETGEAAR